MRAPELRPRTFNRSRRIRIATWARCVGRAGAAAIVLVMVGAALFGWLPSRAPKLPAIDIAALPATLEVTAPGRVSPHAAFSAEVRSSAAVDGSPLVLDVQASFTVVRLHGEFVAGKARIDVPPEMVNDSGHLVLIASTGEEMGSLIVTVLPGDAIDGIIPLAGPRSMVADGQHWTMVTVIAGERFGNGMPDNTPIRLHVRRPDGTSETFDGTFTGMLSGVRVHSGTVAGLTTIRVEVGGATGPEVQVREVAGAPTPFAISTAEGEHVADGRSLFEVRTPQLLDAYGNVVEDGTAVVMVGEGPDGPSRLVTTTIDGRAVLRVRAPSRPGTISARAMVAGTTSAEFRLGFVADIDTFGLSVKRVDSSVEVSVGPVRSSLGGFASDGTTVTIAAGGRTELVRQLFGGTAIGSIDAQPGERIVVKILGRVVEGVAP
jgi:hypothetical protein